MTDFSAAALTNSDSFVAAPSSGDVSNHLLDGVIDLLAGMVGGVAHVYSSQPLDTIKVKMQTFPQLYRNSVKCFTQTFTTDGVRGLYAGTAPALVANVTENAVQFAAYGYCQKMISLLRRGETQTEPTLLDSGLSGALSGVCAALVLCPTELIKCRLQALREMQTIEAANLENSKTPLSGSAPIVRITPWALCRKIMRKEGVLGFCRGMTPTMAREVPGCFFFFGGYELGRELLTPPNSVKDDIGVLKTAAAGAMGGMSCWAVIFPVDVVKSRMQVLPQKGKKSLIGTFLRIIEKEGVSALYRGLAPTLLRMCIGSAFLFTGYEYSKKLMNALIDPDQGKTSVTEADHIHVRPCLI